MRESTYGAPVGESVDVGLGRRDGRTTSHGVVVAVVRRSTHVRLVDDRVGKERE